ncbi:hypothetical protein [Microscilla marina]|uniref:Uncharacterized protein n=1 Tax=Microscilla marina ATCC 23134 TaxID=313606 RepID=A1ZDD2_MICM2|nr:hypothetical protein [Microscilla marina]EAY31671.1 hypothetical protein M23134_05177 [Microscilla marina ATCC 23134]
MKQPFYKILSITLTLLILRSSLPLGVYAASNSNSTECHISPTKELNFWQKFLQVLVQSSTSEKEEENKKEKEKEGEIENLKLRRLLGHLQKALVSHQTHKFQVSYYEWLHHASLTLKAKRFHHLYVFFHKLKIPTSIG